MACAKVVYNRPKLNRYIVNHACYERHDISLSFVAKVNFSDESKEFLAFLKIGETDTIDDIREKIKEKVTRIRNNMQNDTDNSLDILDKLPRWALTWIVVPIVKWMDRHDLLPGALYNDLIYNSTKELLEFGTKMHESLERIDFKTKDLSVLDIDKKYYP